MKDYLKRLLGLLLVLNMSIWAQAVCPMMLFPQASPSCGTHQVAAPVAASSEGSEHQCCPRARQTTSKHEQCPPAKVSDSSAMSCCSVERPPATSSKSVQASPALAVLGRVLVSEVHVPHSDQALVIPASGPTLRGVLNLKEDMRL